MVLNTSIPPRLGISQICRAVSCVLFVLRGVFPPAVASAKCNATPSTTRSCNAHEALRSCCFFWVPGRHRCGTGAIRTADGGEFMGHLVRGPLFRAQIQLHSVSQTVCRAGPPSCWMVGCSSCSPSLRQFCHLSHHTLSGSPKITACKGIIPTC